jgi:hypothetical protein
VSRQFNFFAHANDLPEIERILRKTIGEYFLTESTRGSASSLVPRRNRLPFPCEKSGVLVPYGKTVLIVPHWAIHRVHPVPTHREEVPGELIVETHNDPVMEYECSYFEAETSIAHQGRFYWSFLGRLEPSHQKSVESLFRELRRASERYKNSFLRVFPHAKAQASAFVENTGEAAVKSPFVEE